MEIEKKTAVIEAVLFAAGEPLELHKIAEICDVDAGTVPLLIKSLNNRYEDSGSALCVKRLENSFQLCTREEFAPEIRQALETERNTPLSSAAMEALTVIAYNQPVSKSFVENVRGINSSSVINNLVARGLVEEAGRLDIVGKPVVYRTTAAFLRCFGLSSLEDLPPLDQPPIEDGT